MTDSMQPKAHLVTGAFGFTGKYIAQRLLDAGNRVATLTSSPDRKNSFEGRVEVRPYRFDSVDAMTESLRDVEVLYNTYWVRFSDKSATHSTAVDNTMVLFEAAKRAAVSRIVHISVANPDENSPLAYYKGKGILERELKSSGLNYAIVRPAVLFGQGGILINNIAWTLRMLPVFSVFGKGDYHIQPVYVDDLAKIMVEQGQLRENIVMHALGQEDFTYREFVKTLGEIIGCRRPIFGIPAWMGYTASLFIGMLMRDVFVSKEEIAALMGDLLHVPGVEPTGATRFTDWAKKHAGTLGKRYANEMGRRRDKVSAY